MKQKVPIVIHINVDSCHRIMDFDVNERAPFYRYIIYLPYIMNPYMFYILLGISTSNSMTIIRK